MMNRHQHNPRTGFLASWCFGSMRKLVVFFTILLVFSTSVSAFLSPLNAPRHHNVGLSSDTTTTNFLLQCRPFQSTSLTRLHEEKDGNNGGGGPFDFLSPYDSKIPPELKDEIYKAEANTAAAKDRGQRIAIYSVVAFVGVLCAFFNFFLSELRTGADGVPGVDLATAGFGWVEGNFVTSFLFLNKIGGGICLLGGAGAGLLAEAEFDTKRINAEKIYEEMVRRRDAKGGKKSDKSSPSSSGSKKKKRRSGKESKRLTALSEVVSDDPSTAAEQALAPGDVDEDDVTVDVDVPVESKEGQKDEGKGVLGQIKDFYNRADSMAASQALLMNKKLEDAGIVEKITDESGLKVIGREEAAKLKEKQQQSKSNEKE